LGINHPQSSVDSYRLATAQPPPPGQIIVHDQIQPRPQAFEGTRGFRAWWATPGEFVLCEC
jgi:hypothetical protein